MVKKKSGEVKVASDGLEGVDWTNPVVSQSIEEKEAKMSGLITRFAMRMPKRVANA